MGEREFQTRMRDLALRLYHAIYQRELQRIVADKRRALASLGRNQ